MRLSQLQDKLGLLNDHLTAEKLIAETVPRHPIGVTQGWIAGRHNFLIETLPEMLCSWLSHCAPPGRLPLSAISEQH